MIKNILLATDGSAFAEVAAEYALYLADRLAARLEAVHVIDSRMLASSPVAPHVNCIAWPPADVSRQLETVLRERGEAVLARVAQLAEERSVHLLTNLLSGEPAHVLAQAQNRTELLVLGRRGEHARDDGEFTGSTMDRVVRRASRPCLVTPAAFAPVEKILVAIDGSAVAARALHEAAELANALAAPLLILSVVENPDDLPAARQIVADAHSMVRAHECAAASMALSGPPAERILETADSSSASLVVLGSHGHSRLHDRILGSVAASVLARGMLPVLLVR